MSISKTRKELIEDLMREVEESDLIADLLENRLQLDLNGIHNRYCVIVLNLL